VPDSSQVAIRKIATRKITVHQTTIRQATTDDLAQIVLFTHAIHIQEDDKSIPPHKNFLTNLEKWLLLELKNPLSLLLIAEIKNKSVGFISGSTVINDNGFLENPMKGIINLIWVEKEYRRKNIAQQLLINMEVCFKENSIALIEVSYTSKNMLAKKFWCSMDYDSYSITARKKLITKL